MSQHQNTKTPQTVAVISPKGGTGKTVTTRNLGAALVEHNKRVVLIDADPQQNLSTFAGLTPPGTLTSVLNGRVSLGRALIEIDRLTRLLCSDMGLAELAASGQGDLPDMFKSMINGLDGDFCVIDTPPSVNPLSVAARSVCDVVVMPIPLRKWAITGIRQTIETLKLNTDNLFVLPTFHRKRLRVDREGLTYLKDHYPNVCEPVPDSVKIEEATAYGETVLQNRNPAAKPYRYLASQILKHGAKYVKAKRVRTS